ncbi:MAG: hypothetical protein MUE85_01255 [Microscillaceae bacterium]|jgi:hypothetical protein|nr:hypothetical protein [Microscillaceae bacterium]
MAKSKIKPFENWLYEDVEIVCGIERVQNHPLLVNLLNSQIDIDNTIPELERLSKLLLLQVENWNEEEIKTFFIAPLLGLLYLNHTEYRPFMQRKLGGTVNGVETVGRIDFMIARGKQIPRQPFFCLHEYKQENKRDNDPLGQLLIAMVVAQSKNEVEMPIYGAYVSGRNWFFVVLEDKKYSVSDAYVATSDDIFQIFKILKKHQLMIEDFIQKNP